MHFGWTCLKTLILNKAKTKTKNLHLIQAKTKTKTMNGTKRSTVLHPSDTGSLQTSRKQFIMQCQ